MQTAGLPTRRETHITSLIAAQVFADALRIPRPGPAGRITDAELVALAAEGRVRLADGTPIGCAGYPACAPRSHFAGGA